MFNLQIRPGDVVRLHSGGPAMTVVKKVPAIWECTWFDGGEVRTGSFVELDLAPEQCGATDGRRSIGPDTSGSSFVFGHHRIGS